MKRILLSVSMAGVLLAGCAVNTVNDAPPVDMRGVDGNRYAEDLAACQNKAKNGGFIQLGAPVSSCLEQRGYHVTSRIN